MLGGTIAGIAGAIIGTLEGTPSGPDWPRHFNAIAPPPSSKTRSRSERAGDWNDLR